MNHTDVNWKKWSADWSQNGGTRKIGYLHILACRAVVSHSNFFLYLTAERATDGVVGSRKRSSGSTPTCGTIRSCSQDLEFLEAAASHGTLTIRNGGRTSATYSAVDGGTAETTSLTQLDGSGLLHVLLQEQQQYVYDVPAASTSSLGSNKSSTTGPRHVTEHEYENVGAARATTRPGSSVLDASAVTTFRPAPPAPQPPHHPLLSTSPLSEHHDCEQEQNDWRMQADEHVYSNVPPLMQLSAEGTTMMANGLNDDRASDAEKPYEGQQGIEPPSSQLYAQVDREKKIQVMMELDSRVSKRYLFWTSAMLRWEKKKVRPVGPYVPSSPFKSHVTFSDPLYFLIDLGYDDENISTDWEGRFSKSLSSFSENSRAFKKSRADLRLFHSQLLLFFIHNTRTCDITTPRLWTAVKLLRIYGDSDNGYSESSRNVIQ